MATVTITTGEFRKLARWAKPDPKHPLPVLANVRVSVVGTQLVLTVFDWETCLLARAHDPAADPAQAASVLIPAAQLGAALEALPPGRTTRVEVTVHHDDKVDLVTGAGTAKAQRISVGQHCDPGKYPALPAMPSITGWADGPVLAQALTHIAGCCSTDDTLPAIGCVRLVPGAGTLSLEGTNRHLIGLDEVPFTRQAPAPFKGEGFLIPAALAARFAGYCEGGPVFIGAPGPDGMALLSDGWHTLVTKVITGEYPAVRTVAARKHPVRAEFTVDAQVLAKAAGEASVLLDGAVKEMCDGQVDDEPGEDLRGRHAGQSAVDKRRDIRIDHGGHGMFLSAGPAGVEVFAVHPGTQAELGRWVTGPATGEEETVVSLNPDYLTRLLPPSGEVTIRLSAPAKPVGVTTPGSLFQGVIAPIKATPPARTEQEKEPALA